MAKLDPQLMQKVATKLGIPKTSLNVRVSKKASKLGISSEAALVLIAKELAIGTSVFQGRLPPHIQNEIKISLPSIASFPQSAPQKQLVRGASRPTEPSKKAMQKVAIEFIIQDTELRSRCEDLLLGKSHFDRAINQATLVLEDRLRKAAKPSAKLVGENLAGYALNAQFDKTALKISGNEDEQRGIADIVRGIVPAFRNTTHHHLVDKFTREDAMRVCGFIDVLLRVIDGAEKLR